MECWDYTPARFAAKHNSIMSFGLGMAVFAMCFLWGFFTILRLTTTVRRQNFLPSLILWRTAPYEYDRSPNPYNLPVPSEKRPTRTTSPSFSTASESIIDIFSPVPYPFRICDRKNPSRI